MVLLVEKPSVQSKTISEMASLYCVSLRTLRFYESIGILHPVRYNKVERHYFPDDELRLQIVLRGKRLGFSLQHIKQLMDEQSASNSKLGHICETLSKRSIEIQIEKLEEQRNILCESISELYNALNIIKNK